MNPSPDYPRRVHALISTASNQASGPLLRRFILTLLPPFLVFIGTGAASSFARALLEAQFNDAGLNTLTWITTTLLMLVLTWWTWQFCERRFGGLRALGLMLAVLRSMNALETGLKLVQRDPETTAPIDEIAADALAAWDRLSAHLGLPPIERP